MIKWKVFLSRSLRCRRFPSLNRSSYSDSHPRTLPALSMPMAEIPALHPWKQAPSAPRRRSSSSVKYPTLSAAPSINGASARCRITKAMTSAGSMRQSSPRAALPIGEHACSCHADGNSIPHDDNTRRDRSHREKMRISSKR